MARKEGGGGRPITCPNRGTVVRSASMAESEYDAYLAVVVKGMTIR